MYVYVYVSSDIIKFYLFSRYVCVGTSVPELALTAVQVLYWVTQSNKAGRDVVTTIISDKVSKTISWSLNPLETG